MAREWAGDAGLDTTPGSRFWSLGPAGLARLRRHALRPAAEAVAAIYTVHRNPQKRPHPFTAEDVMPAVFQTAESRREAAKAAAHADDVISRKRAEISRKRAARERGEVQ